MNQATQEDYDYITTLCRELPKRQRERLLLQVVQGGGIAGGKMCVSIPLEELSAVYKELNALRKSRRKR